MNRCRLTLLQFTAAACFCTSLTATAVPVDVKADFYFGPDMSRNQACDNAREAAKAKAIALVSGENIASDQSMHCRQSANAVRDQACDIHRNAWTLVEGRIRKSELISETVKAVQGAHVCTVNMVFDVVPPATDADPGFDLRVQLNRHSFRAGEALEINIMPATPMYISVFNWRPAFSRDNVVRLFPNDWDTQNFIQGPVRLPTRSASQAYSFELEWLAPAGQEPDSMSEWVMVVATKKPMPWLAVYDMQRFKEKLLEIPADQRRVVHRPYVLMR
jgi:hypothetical protein